MRDESFHKKLFDTWYPLMKPIVYTERFDKLIDDLNIKYNTKRVFPEKKDAFKAFRVTPMHKTKVIIIGENVYPNSFETGLAFANPEDSLPINPSLQKIFDSVEKDYYDGFLLNPDWTLERWANQGVMLINATLTAEYNKPESHIDLWKGFFKVFITRLASNSSNLVFCLWGNNSKGFKQYIENTGNYIIEAEHPTYAVEQNRDWNFSFKEIDKHLTNKINW